MRDKRGSTRSASGALRASWLGAMAVGAVALLAACGGSSSASQAVARAGNPRACSALTLYTWEGEAPSTLLKPFEQQYGVPVKVSYITSGAESLAKMAAGGVKQYDIIFDGSEDTQPMKEAGVIKPLDTSKFPEYSKLFPFTTKTFEVGGKVYTLSEDWGKNPFIYNTEVLKTPPTSWSVLWSPQLKGQVSLWEDVSLIWIGAAVLGYDKNPDQLFHLSQAQLDAIRNKMLQLKGNVRTVWNSGGDLIQLFATHEVGAAQGWSFIYNELKAKHEPVAEAKLANMGAQGWAEGASLSSDISANCEAAAYAFLNWTISPKGAAALATSSGYTPSNPGAAAYMSKQLIEQTGLNNPKAFLGSAIFKQALSDPQAYNQTMEEIIAGLK